MKSTQRIALGVVLSVGLAAGAYGGTAAMHQAPAPEAGLALAAILFAVVWWAFGVTAPALTALLLLWFFLVSGIAPPEAVLALWSGPLAWLMIGSFLLAHAVTKSGLGRRIALILLLRFVDSYRGLIVVLFILHLLLAPLVPLPNSRALLIMALMREWIERSDLDREMAAAVGFAVFAGAIPPTLMFLTGDAVLNSVAAGFAGGLSWLEWFVLMVVPALVTWALMLAGHLLVFRPPGALNIDKRFLAEELRALGPLRPAEIRTLAWLTAAILLWVTDAIHGIDPAWVGLGAAVGLGLPWVGNMFTGEDLGRGVDWTTMIFATGALAIGAVGQATGLSAWMVDVMFPETLPATPAGFLILAGAVAAVLRLFTGSVLATLSMLLPPILTVGDSLGLPPAIPMLAVHMSIFILFALPFHNLLILLGSGPLGSYSQRETLRFFPVQVLVTAAALAAALLWWSLLGKIE